MNEEWMNALNLFVKKQTKNTYWLCISKFLHKSTTVVGYWLIKPVLDLKCWSKHNVKQSTKVKERLTILTLSKGLVSVPSAGN